jgi:hypothetical protein
MVPKQGEIYKVDTILPPNQADNHYFLVLTNSGHIRNHSHPTNRYCLTGCIVRSATNKKGAKVKEIKGYSFLITPQEFPFLQHDSIIETHQIFHLDIKEFDKTTTKCLGRVNDQSKLQNILDSAKSLFEI